MAYIATGAGVWAITQVGLRTDGFSPGVAGSIAGNVVGVRPPLYDASPQTIVLRGSDLLPVPFLFDIELQAAAISPLAPNEDMAYLAALQSAAITALAPTEQMAATLALQAIAFAQLAPTEQTALTLALGAIAVAGLAPTEAQATDAPLDAAAITPLEPITVAIGATLALLEMQLLRFDPTVEIGEVRYFTAGLSRRTDVPVGKAAWVHETLELRLEALPLGIELRAHLPPIDVAAVTFALEALGPDVVLDYARIRRAEEEEQLLLEEDLLGIGV